MSSLSSLPERNFATIQQRFSATSCLFFATTARDDVESRDSDAILPGFRRDRLTKMADSLSSGLGEEKEKEDSEWDKKSTRLRNNWGKDGFTESLRFSDKNGDSKDKKRDLSGGR